MVMLLSATIGNRVKGVKITVILF